MSILPVCAGAREIEKVGKKLFSHPVTDNNIPGTIEYTVYMWQSRVEIEGYFVVYFDCIAAFEAPYR